MMGESQCVESSSTAQLAIDRGHHGLELWEVLKS
jgi:hypothetical protein